MLVAQMGFGDRMDVSVCGNISTVNGPLALLAFFALPLAAAGSTPTCFSVSPVCRVCGPAAGPRRLECYPRWRGASRVAGRGRTAGRTVSIRRSTIPGRRWLRRIRTTEELETENAAYNEGDTSNARDGHWLAEYENAENG